MAIEIRIPAVMRSNAAGQATVSCSGETVGEALSDLVEQYPGIEAVLFNEDKALHKYVNIYLGADDIRYIGGLDAPIGDVKELTILPAVAGA